MKKYIIVIIIAIFYSGLNAQIRMNSSGFVSIGYNVSPSSSYSLLIEKSVKISNGSFPGLIIDQSGSNYGLALYPSSNNAGNIGLSTKAFAYVWSYGGSITLSDGRQKENIRNLNSSNALNKEFAYSDSIVKENRIKEKLEKDRKNKIGFIAQDVYKVLPEIVVYDDSTDIYGIIYEKITPVLVEAIKELYYEIDSLKTIISSSTTIDNQMAKKNATSETTIETINGSEQAASLRQNQPNPFSENTAIDYYLPSTIQNATFYVYDMQGKQIKSMKVNEREYGRIIINSYELQPGMYYYSLIADGEIIGTEKMVLTD
jgi:hypothetical protein